MNRLARRLCRFILLGFLLSRTAVAEGLLESETFSLRGFGTLGGVYNFSDQADFIRDKNQPDGARGAGVTWELDSRLGLQATWKPHSDVETTVQMVSKYRYDGSYRPELTWGFLKYAINPDMRIRAGRLGVGLYLLSDSRDVGYSYLWVRPPVDYFGQLFISYLDGVDWTVEHVFGDGVVRSKLHVGLSSGKTAFDYDLDGAALLGGYLEYQNPHWLFRVGYVGVRLENEASTAALLDVLRGTGVPEAASLAEAMRLAGKRLHFFSAGAAYDDGPLQSQLMLSHISTESLASLSNSSGYFSIGYRIGQWTPYLVYSRIKTEHPEYTTGLPSTPPFDAINAAVAGVIGLSQADQDTVSLGVRYDFAPNAALKLQVDRIYSRDNPSRLWINPDPEWDGRATVVSATLDFVF